MIIGTRLAEYRRHFPLYPAQRPWWSRSRHCPVLTRLQIGITKHRTKKSSLFFKKKKTLSERMFKAWLNFFLLRLRLCCRDRFDVFPSGWRPPSLPSCDAGDRTQLTTFNKLYLLLVGGSLCTCWSVLCALPPPALTCFDPAGPLHIHTGRIKHVQLCLQLFRCSDKYSCCCLMFPPLWWLVVTNKAHNIRH